MKSGSIKPGRWIYSDGIVKRRLPGGDKEYRGAFEILGGRARFLRRGFKSRSQAEGYFHRVAQRKAKWNLVKWPWWKVWKCRIEKRLRMWP
jgi:hypothetical protein